ncbi:MAG: HAMP domain-containing histidine kinase [Alistipes sp.]|nr:HAMP domain-containing histidine kinase [Alistipes sp.]
MREQNFRVVSVVVVLALALLVAVEAMWSVRTYRDMREKYEQQICSVMEEAAWKYATNSMNGDAAINIGNISRFHAFVGEGLRTAGLATDFRVEVLSTTDAEPIVIMAMGELSNNEDVISVDKRLTPLILRLTVADPHSAILGDMKRMLIMQGISVLLLIIAFLYMLRSLFRAKEVEKIRRDLTHNITHELKTPIAAAYASVDALRTMPEIVDEQRSDYLDMAHGELQRLGAMVDEILRSSTEKFATAELRFEECDVAKMVERVVKSLDMRYASRNVEWSVDMEDGCAVVADAFYLEGALSALVDNAIKYSSERPKVKLCGSVRNGYTYVSVEDCGIGIPRKEQKRIFDKFYRITTGDKYSTSGYGIGLYFVRSVVERHGGSVSLTSTLGEGSCFTLKLLRYGK